MKKSVLFILCLSALITFSGCGNKEDTKTDKANNEVVSQTAETEETENNSLLGTWVVEKNEVYDGPLKEMTKSTLNILYYVGAEYTFKEDGTFSNADNSVSIKSKVLNDKQIEWEDIISGQKSMSDYKLNGDELVVYANYTGDYTDLGYAGATYFKRK